MSEDGPLEMILNICLDGVGTHLLGKHNFVHVYILPRFHSQTARA